MQTSWKEKKLFAQRIGIFGNPANVSQKNKNLEFFKPFLYLFGPKNLIPLRKGSVIALSALFRARLINSSKEPPGDQPTFGESPLPIGIASITLDARA